VLENLQGIKHRILVTGSRAKSSLVRLLHAVFVANGLLTRSRITGVIPRELGQKAERIIGRTSPGHISEIKWWAEQIPPDTQAIVAENSAVNPELQPVAAELLGPTLVVWTNCRPDHEDAWGAGKENASRALLCGIPEGVPVTCGTDIDINIKELLKTRKNTILNPVPLSKAYAELPQHLRENMELASAVCCAIGFEVESSLDVMASLPPDIADFQIIKQDSRQLASAFSANEPVSTALLFETTKWKPEETTILYHHRIDRTARLMAFLPWMDSLPWKERVFTCNVKLSPFQKTLRALSIPAITWNDNIQDVSSFLEFWEGQVFGCGNVAGWPLDYLLSMRQKEG
jgi:hypothetical protein